MCIRLCQLQITYFAFHELLLESKRCLVEILEKLTVKLFGFILRPNVQDLEPEILFRKTISEWRLWLHCHLHLSPCADRVAF